MKLTQLTSEDVPRFQFLIRLFHEVFETESKEMASAAYLRQLLAQENFIVLAAMEENEVIGGLTAYVLAQYYGEYSEVYIYDIAVAKKFQGMGVGKKLIAELKTFCAANKFKAIFVEAHEEDTEAVEFYHKTGGEAEKVVHFNYNL